MMPAQAWVTLIVGLVAVAGVVVTWRQKNEADRRSEWWRRVTWAYERVFSNSDDEQRLGWRLLDVLMASKLAANSDSDYIQAIAEHIALEEDEVDAYDGQDSSEVVDDISDESDS